MIAPHQVVAAAEAILRDERARRAAQIHAARRARRTALSHAVARNTVISLAAIAGYALIVATIITVYALAWAFSK